MVQLEIVQGPSLFRPGVGGAGVEQVHCVLTNIVGPSPYQAFEAIEVLGEEGADGFFEPGTVAGHARQESVCRLNRKT